MPSPEKGRGLQGEPNKENEIPPYYQAARFQAELSAGRAYAQAQQIIYHDELCDLSAYRLQLDHIWHVTVMGEPPSNETDAAIAQILSAGEIVPLPAQVLKLLQERRLQATQHGSWVEGHYRPGKHLDR